MANQPGHGDSDEEGNLEWCTAELPESRLATETQEGPADNTAKYAFISILFGKKVAYCINAVGLGEALRTSSTKRPYILLSTSDVPSEWKVVLQKVGWELREGEYLDGEHLYCCGSA